MVSSRLTDPISKCERKWTTFQLDLSLSDLSLALPRELRNILATSGRVYRTTGLSAGNLIPDLSETR